MISAVGGEYTWAMRILLYALFVALAIGILSWFLYLGGVSSVVLTTTFEECVAQGNPVMESYPRQCRGADGQVFVEEVGQSAPVTDSITMNACAVAGCSGQLCVAAGEAASVVTDCMFRAEYACYREAACEPQADGQCGWTMTSALDQCLVNPPVE